MASLYLPEGFYISTLSSDLTAAATSIPVTTVPSDITKGYLVVEPSSATKREIIHFTSVGASTVTATDDTTDANDATGRGCKGSIAAGANTSHDQGVTVLIAATYQYWKRLYDKLTGNDTTVLVDTNGNELLLVSQVASAVNEITIKNAATGNAPEIQATGSDTNIDFALTAKGTGKLKQDAYYQTPQTYTPSAAATATLDLSTGNEHRITMPAGNITIAISNETNGQKFIVSILQDDVGSRTVTWFSTIKWSGGSAPTLTTTADKRDVYGFIVTGTDTYDGFVIGSNI